MVVSDELLITSIVDAQPESVIWFKPIFHTYGGEAPRVTDFEVRYCNQAASELLEAPKEIIIGQMVLQSDLMDEGSKKVTFEQCNKVWTTGEQEQFIYF